MTHTPKNNAYRFVGGNNQQHWQETTKWDPESHSTRTFTGEMLQRARTLRLIIVE